MPKDDNKPLTKAEFRKIGLTKDEFQRIGVTKDEFRTELRMIYARFDTIEAKMVTRDEFLTHMDRILTQMSEIRQEFILHSARMERIGEQVENHEQRITTLEKVA